MVLCRDKDLEFENEKLNVVTQKLKQIENLKSSRESSKVV